MRILNELFDFTKTPLSGSRFTRDVADHIKIISELGGVIDPKFAPYKNAIQYLVSYMRGTTGAAKSFYSAKQTAYVFDFEQFIPTKDPETGVLDRKLPYPNFNEVSKIMIYPIDDVSLETVIREAQQFDTDFATHGAHLAESIRNYLSSCYNVLTNSKYKGILQRNTQGYSTVEQFDDMINQLAERIHEALTATE